MHKKSFFIIITQFIFSVCFYNEILWRTLETVLSSYFLASPENLCTISCYATPSIFPWLVTGWFCICDICTISCYMLLPPFSIDCLQLDSAFVKYAPFRIWQPTCPGTGKFIKRSFNFWKMTSWIFRSLSSTIACYLPYPFLDRKELCQRII